MKQTAEHSVAAPTLCAEHLWNIPAHRAAWVHVGQTEGAYGQLYQRFCHFLETDAVYLLNDAMQTLPKGATSLLPLLPHWHAAHTTANSLPTCLLSHRCLSISTCDHTLHTTPRPGQAQQPHMEGLGAVVAGKSNRSRDITVYKALWVSRTRGDTCEARQVFGMRAVRETEILMENQERWRALPQEEQQEQESQLSQNGAAPPC